MNNTNEQLITAGFMSKFAEKCKNAFRPKILKSEDLINPYLLIITDILYNNEDNELYKLLFHITNSDLETVNSYITFQASNDEGKQLIDLTVHNFGYISPVASGVYDNKLALLIKILGNVACDVISESQNVINSEDWVVKFVDVEIQDNLLLIESKSFDIFKIYNISKDFLLDFEHEIDTTSFYTQIKKGDKVFEYLPYMHTEVEEEDIVPTEVLFGEGIIEGIRKSNISDVTKKFSSEKTISFPESSDFITYGEPTTSNFENEIELPEVIFDGIEPKKTSDTSSLRPADIDEDGEWFNRIFIKPEHKGLVYRVTNVEESENTNALPYEKTTDDLYFRIDPDKSIDADNASSIQNVTFAEFINNLAIAGEYLSGEESNTKKKVATITNNSGKDLKCSFLTFNTYPSKILEMSAESSPYLPNNGDFILMTLDEEYIGTWHVETDGGASQIYVKDNSYFTLFNSGEDADSFVNDDQVTCHYQWRTITIPAGLTDIYIKPEDYNSSWSFNGLYMSFNGNCSTDYDKYFRKITNEDPYVKIESSINLIIIGNDGLKISCGDNLYKILITANGIVAG